MNPPCQELVAKDLHGFEWNFRHIYRGIGAPYGNQCCVWRLCKLGVQSKILTGGDEYMSCLIQANLGDIF